MHTADLKPLKGGGIKKREECDTRAAAFEIAFIMYLMLICIANASAIRTQTNMLRDQNLGEKHIL